MRDAAIVKVVSIAGSVVIVCVMLAKDGNVALAAAATLLATLSGLGGAAIMASKRAT